MTGATVKASRKKSGRTQAQLARLLGVTQAYVSQMEKSRRRVPDRLARKLVGHLGLPATALPVSASRSEPLDSKLVAEELARLAYPGMAYLKKGVPTRNPSEVFMAALASDDLDARLVEALPWILLRFPDLDLDGVTRFAKLRDLQNRLGFLVGLAREVAETQPAFRNRLDALRTLEQILEKSRLVREDDFGEGERSAAMREWLRRHRSQLAEHWNMLSDLKVEHLPYARP